MSGAPSESQGVDPHDQGPDDGGLGGDDRIVRRHRGLAARTVLVSLLTLLSRLLGFVREMVAAALFGHGSAVFDAFLTAWRIPNLFRRLFGEGALSTSLQTAITEEDGDRGNEAGRRLFLATLAQTLWILIAVSAIAMVLVSWMPDRMPVTGWAWLGADPGPVRDLTVRLMPFVVLVCLAALCGGALNVRGHYAAPNLAPTVMNLVWITSLVLVGWRHGWAESGVGEPAEVLARQWGMARLLAWGVLIGGLIQLGIHLPPLVRFGLAFRREGAAPVAAAPARPGETRRALDVLLASAPLALGAAVYQINVMIDGLMAEGLLSNGGPTAHYLANRVQQFPLALVAIAATNAVFPSLKALGHLGRNSELRELHDRTQLGILFLALPAAAGLFVLSEPIATVLFQRGNYGPEGVARTAAVLRVLALALLPAGAVGLLTRAFYALDDFRTPVRISIAMLLVNVVLNVLFVVGLRMDADGLALGTMLSGWGSLLLLYPVLRRRLGPSGLHAGLSVRLGKMVAAALACGVGAFAAQRGMALALGLDEAEAARSVVVLGAAAASGGLLFLAAARCLGIPEANELLRRLAGRFGRETETP